MDVVLGLDEADAMQRGMSNSICYRRHTGTSETLSLNLNYR